MIGALGRNVVQQFLGQVAVGVNHPDSMAKGDVLNDEIPQERRLAGAGLSDDVNVLSLVSGRYAKRLRVTPTFAVSDDNGWFVIHGSRISRRSCHGGSLCVVRLPLVVLLKRRQSVLGHAGEVMATGSEIRIRSVMSD